MAHGSKPARPILGRRPEGWLSGCGLLDLPQVHPIDRAKAAWLYAQFVVSKTVVKKSHVGLTFIRDSSVNHESFTERAPKLGGLVEFYRSPDRVAWSPTGINVPDYPKLAQIWWQQIGDVNSGAFTPQEAMDRLAEEMDVTMARMQAADEACQCIWRLRSTPERARGSWNGKKGGAAKLGEAEGEAVDYDARVAAGRLTVPIRRLRPLA